MGLASFHVFKKTHEQKYLKFAERIAEFALSLQNSNKNDANCGGICLGPTGDPNFPTDQHLGYSENMPTFDRVYATEIQIDAHAL